MKGKLMCSVATAVALVITPVALAACDMSLGYLPLNGPGVGGGINIQPGSDGSPTYWTANGLFSIAVGESAFVAPGLGICSSTGDNSETDIVFGGGFGANVWSNPAETVDVHVNAALTFNSFEGGNEQSVPVTAQAVFQAGEAANLFAGAGLRIGRISSTGGDGSRTDADPMAVVGAAIAAGAGQVMGGLYIVNGDGGTDVGINGGVRIPVN